MAISFYTETIKKIGYKAPVFDFKKFAESTAKIKGLFFLNKTRE
jgi:hypothetical protein